MLSILDNRRGQQCFVKIISPQNNVLAAGTRETLKKYITVDFIDTQNENALDAVNY